jgi:hypothetical protein
MKYAAWAVHTEAGREHVAAGVLFKVPAKTDPQSLLVHAQKREQEGVVTYTIKPEHIRRRHGFALTDPGTDLTGALDQANYCIWCHEQAKDSCSKASRRSRRRTLRARWRSRRPLRRHSRRLPLEERSQATLKARGRRLP